MQSSQFPRWCYYRMSEWGKKWKGGKKKTILILFLTTIFFCKHRYTTPLKSVCLSVCNVCIAVPIIQSRYDLDSYQRDYNKFCLKFSNSKEKWIGLKYSCRSQLEIVPSM